MQMSERQQRRAERLELLRQNKIGRAKSVLETVNGQGPVGVPKTSFRPSDLLGDFTASPEQKETTMPPQPETHAPLSSTAMTQQPAFAMIDAQVSAQGVSCMLLTMPSMTDIPTVAPVKAGKKVPPPVAPKPTATRRGTSVPCNEVIDTTVVVQMTGHCLPLFAVSEQEHQTQASDVVVITEPSAPLCEPEPVSAVQQQSLSTASLPPSVTTASTSTPPAPSVHVTAEESFSGFGPSMDVDVEPPSNLVATKFISASLESVLAEAARDTPTKPRYSHDDCVLGVTPVKPRRGVKREGTRLASSVVIEDHYDDVTLNKSARHEAADLGPRDSVSSRSKSYSSHCHEGRATPTAVPPMLASSLVRTMSKSAECVFTAASTPLALPREAHVSFAHFGHGESSLNTPMATPSRGIDSMATPGKTRPCDMLVHAIKLPVDRELERQTKVPRGQTCSTWTCDQLLTDAVGRRGPAEPVAAAARRREQCCRAGGVAGSHSRTRCHGCVPRAPAAVKHNVRMCSACNRSVTDAQLQLWPPKVRCSAANPA